MSRCLSTVRSTFCLWVAKPWREPRLGRRMLLRDRGFGRSRPHSWWSPRCCRGRVHDENNGLGDPCSAGVLDGAGKSDPLRLAECDRNKREQNGRGQACRGQSPAHSSTQHSGMESRLLQDSFDSSGYARSVGHRRRCGRRHSFLLAFRSHLDQRLGISFRVPRKQDDMIVTCRLSQFPQATVHPAGERMKPEYGVVQSATARIHPSRRAMCASSCKSTACSFSLPHSSM